MADQSNWSVQYLRVIGRLYPDGRLRLRPSYLTSEAPWSDREGSGPDRLAAELVDEAGQVLGRYPLRVYRTCGLGSVSRTEAVRAWIPFHPRTSAVRFTLEARLVHEIRRSTVPPAVKVTWRPHSRTEGRQRVSWKAEHAESAGLEFLLRYSHDGGSRWQRVGWRTRAQEVEVDFEQLPGGEHCLLAVVATDGINTTVAQSELFTVALKPCQAIVIAPVDGTSFRRGDTVEFVGQGFWLEGGKVERDELFWESSRDGALGRGARVAVASLSEGEHRITLVAGHQGRQGRESVTIFYGSVGPGGQTSY